MSEDKTRHRNEDQASDRAGLRNLANVKQLLAAGARASSLGIATFDEQGRFASINSSLAREGQMSQDCHLGKTGREIIGDLALQTEFVFERVWGTGNAETLRAMGCVRDGPVFGQWLNHCFPIFDGSGRVQQLGLFVVNVTAEESSRDIFDALSRDSKFLMAEAAGLLDKFDESILHYHLNLKRSFDQLACPFTEVPRKVDRFRSSIIQLDNEISAMRELVYAVLAHFSIPEC